MIPILLGLALAGDFYDQATTTSTDLLPFNPSDAMGGQQVGWMMSVGSGTIMVGDGLLSQNRSVVDASSAEAIDNLGQYFQQTTAATANSIAYHQPNGPDEVPVDALPWTVGTYAISGASDIGWGYGWAHNNVAGSREIVQTDTDPNSYHVAFGFQSSRSDSNIMLLSSATNGGTQTRTDTGIAISAMTYPNALTFGIWWVSLTEVQVRIWDPADRSVLYEGSITTGLPATTSVVWPVGAVVTRTTAARSLYFWGWRVGINPGGIP